MSVYNNNRILNQISSDLATTRGITMTYSYDFHHRGISLRLSKGNNTIQKVISNYEIIRINGELFDHILAMVDTLEASIARQQANNMSIPLPEDWRSKELNMTTDISIEGQIVPVTVGGGGGTGAGVIPTIFISGTKSGSIVMDEIATTTQKFSDNDIARIGDLKRRAKNLITQMLRVQDPIFDMINKDKFVLAGGCFTSWYHGESPKDHDVFVLGGDGNKLHRDQWPEERYKLGDANYLKAMNHSPKLVDVILDKQTNVQYIFTQYAAREELIKHFDVEHVCVSYTPHDDKLYISPLAFDCMKNKKLKAHNGDIKSVAAWRLHKFELKGFTVETVSV